ncbi:MAG: pentapeptide repeat-containing protein, partial [Candidatus Thorarchaeota archaeon]
MSAPARILYHGSPKLFQTLKPKAHYLANNKPVVFATPLREIALASLQPWNDGIFEQGIVGEDPPYMLELQPNAFKEVYEGKAGYLYSLDPRTFHRTNRLTRFEQISEVSPEILEIEFIPDALEALQASSMQMITFDEAEMFKKNNYRRNPIPKSKDQEPVSFIDQVSRNENLDGEGLRDANLKGSDLSGSSFRNADLSGAVLFGCDLRNCDFTGANLDRTNLGFAKVEGAIFDDCSMDNTLLFDPEEIFTIGEFNPSSLTIAGFVIQQARKSSNEMLDALRKADDLPSLGQYMALVEAFLGYELPYEEPYTFEAVYTKALYVVYESTEINLRELNLAEADLGRAYLEKADLENSDLAQANFQRAKLQEANLQGTTLQEANFYEANLLGANLQGASAPMADFDRAKLQHVNFKGADLHHSELRQADLRQANLQEADLKLCSFHRADLRDANLKDA